MIDHLCICLLIVKVTPLSAIPVFFRHEILGFEKLRIFHIIKLMSYVLKFQVLFGDTLVADKKKRTLL